MVGLTSLEVYNSVFDKRENNNKFELYTDVFDEFFFRIERWAWGDLWYFIYFTRASTTWKK